MSLALRLAPLVFVAAVVQVSAISGCAHPRRRARPPARHDRGDRSRRRVDPGRRRGVRGRDPPRRDDCSASSERPRSSSRRSGTGRAATARRPVEAAATRRPLAAFALSIAATLGGVAAPLPARPARLRPRGARHARCRARCSRPCSSCRCTACADGSSPRSQRFDRAAPRGARMTDAPYGEPRRASTPLPPARPGRRGAVPADARARAPRRRPRRRRARDLRGALLPALVAPGPLRRHVSRRRAGQPAPDDPDRGAARDDPRPQRPRRSSTTSPGPR